MKEYGQDVVLPGMKFAVKDPPGAIAHIKAAEPLANEATELKRLKLAIAANIVNDEVKKNGFGAIDQARMQRAIAQVAQSFQLEKTPPVEQVFTSAYLPASAARKLE